MIRWRYSHAAMAAWVLLTGLAFGDATVPYRVAFEGAPNGGISAAMKAASDLVTLERKPPASLDLLQRRLDRDLAKLREVLEAEGYYDATLKGDIDGAQSPAHVTVRVEAGERYRIVDLRYVEPEGQPPSGAAMPGLAELKLKPDNPARADDVTAAEKKLIRLLKKQGFAYAAVSRRTIEIDREKKTGALVYYVDAGPKGRFGNVAISGLESVEEEAVRRKIAWHEGDPFNGDLVDKLKKSLIASNLFAMVEVTTPAKPDGGDLVPVSIKLVERKHRTISAGINYTTDEGIGGQVNWEDRNLTGRGDRLSLGAVLSELSQNVEGGYTVQDFLRANQSLQLKARVGRDAPDAYTNESARVSAIVERKISDETKAGVGIEFRPEHVTQTGLAHDFMLASVPMYVTREHLDDPLNPLSGQKLSLKLTPFVDLLRQGDAFVKTQAGYNQFLPILEKPACVLAWRLVMGTMVGDQRIDIPADERFYAGGANSIRGYGYQTVAPLDGKHPIGGKSIVEISGELRFRVRENLDLVGFIDGGNAYSKEIPDIGQMFWGAGVGVCYHSKIGPIRIDLATPLNKRSGIDDSFQAYVTLGNWF